MSLQNQSETHEHDQSNSRNFGVVVTGSWSPISRILSMSSSTFLGSFALVRISGLRILSRGISRMTGPPDLEEGKAAPVRKEDSNSRNKTGIQQENKTFKPMS